MKRWGKKLRSFKNSNDMVAEIIGTVLLLAITVGIFSLMYATVVSHPPPYDSSLVKLVATLEGRNIIIEHRGGESLNLKSKVEITIDNNTSDIIVGDYLDDDAKSDNQWNVGERLVYPFNYSLDYDEAKIMVIDEESNSLVLIGTLDITPDCDIGVEAVLANKSVNGNITEYLKVTATNYRGDLDYASEVIIKITLKGDVKYKEHIATNGTSYSTYSEYIGFWDIDSLFVGETAVLDIFINVQGSLHPGMGTICAVEIVSSAPRDINPENDKADVIL